MIPGLADAAVVSRFAVTSGAAETSGAGGIFAFAFLAAVLRAALVAVFQIFLSKCSLSFLAASPEVVSLAMVQICAMIWILT